MISTRLLAAQALLRVEQGGYSQLVLDGALQRAALSTRDAALTAALFYGALERKLTLDWCIDRYARHTLTPEIRSVLRVAVYQLLYMPRIPQSAAVSEAVESARAMRQTSASGMVNGMLRSFQRDECAIRPPAQGTIASLRVLYSCDEGLIERIISWYGVEKGEAILAASLGQPPVYLRVNPLRTDAVALRAALVQEGLTVSDGPLPHCLIVSGDAAHTKAHAAGLFHIQDLSSQRAALALDVQPGDRLLDVCAAPGSKSFVLAEQMQNLGEIVACDVAQQRLELIRRGAARLGISILTAQQNDGAVLNLSLGLFDRVLCDVPCSGLGVLRRKPELKYRIPDSIGALPALQYKILETSSHYCREHGTLVYSTCTLNPDENEGVIARFLAANHAFAPAPISSEACYETVFPDQEGGDGFFIARMMRIC
ncbi:MAG: 16S rRNA (cytosine(967)-C(5))-methyltransferase RsmB [Oscillospiraceae bacterium]